ncbi:hypothetical protein DICPUDRAFT_57002 [Dictyostelium purpureum]|uniref:Ribonuclease H2 subunit B n=1 Tax=Dictyostelium purpureum TaxID=5786 RepID=F0ZTU6_DICPU|nr:uncharacterized protein DICPUDRAFT_57002 [Dictyostelium purpureum]EGC32622.1 hypothetical protein DICPUDRAFT_57002 [Dictyostelium purpureum]|eukprot:XP_003290837.1 hypothetical protein DICPUDRAFT_57002 [Dictyostelium purpureum]
MSNKKEDLENDLEDIEEDLSNEESSDDGDDGVTQTKKRKKPSAATPKVKPHPPIPKLPYTDRVFIVQDNSSNSEDDFINFEIITLPSPKYEKTYCRYIKDKINNKILEINKFNSNPSSWFIDNGARNDGSMYIASNIDPLFLLIPFLEKNKTQNKNEYFEVSSVVNDPIYSNLSKITFKDEQLKLICDFKDFAGSSLYKLDDEKLLLWLRCKVKNIANHLKDNDIDIFKTSNHVKNVLSWETLYTMSIGFISEYLSDAHIKLLNESFGLLSDKAKETIQKESADLVYTEKIIEPEPSKPKKAASKKGSAKKAAAKPAPSITTTTSPFFTKVSSTSSSDDNKPKGSLISDYFSRK